MGERSVIFHPVVCDLFFAVPLADFDGSGDGCWSNFPSALFFELFLQSILNIGEKGSFFAFVDVTTHEVNSC